LYSSAELEKSAEQILPGRERGRGEKGGAMTQTMYAHVNK
jgi:hypothetical protein